MARPVTLFTGQWADLPLETLAAKAAEWGFDGLELACWGDHFEVERGRRDRLRGVAARAARAARPRLLRGRRASRRAGRLRSDRRAAPGRPPARRLGRRRARGRPPARRRADEGHRPRGGRARRDAGERLHRLVDLAPPLLLPAERLRRGRGGVPGLRRAL